MIDDLDRRLISLLRSNARTPVAALARDLGVNRSTVTARIDALTGSGVIEAFTIRLSDEVDRDAIRAVALVLSEPKYGKEVVKTVRGFPEVEHLHSTLGSWDLVVQLRAPSLAAFDAALEKIRAIDGVKDTQTYLLVNSLTSA